MSFIKYRVKEVAADFGVTPKEISDIISKYHEKPKSYTQVLTDNELNTVFDHITQHNQIASLEQVFAVKPAPKEIPKEAPKPAAPAAGQSRPQQNAQNRPQQGNQNRPQQQNAQNRPQQNAQSRPQQQSAPAAAKPAEPERKRERRVVDTSAVQVNANRFADVDNLVSERVQNYEGGKQRIGAGKGKQKQQLNNKKGYKARNEDQEKLRRLQMEVAR